MVSVVKGGDGIGIVIFGFDCAAVYRKHTVSHCKHPRPSHKQI